MPIEVEAPDGTIVEFPDGMTDEQIAAVMRRTYAPETLTGYDKAREREERVRRETEEAGAFTGPNFFTQATAPFQDEAAGAIAYADQGLRNIARQITGREIEIPAADAARAASDVVYDRQQRFEDERPAQALAGQWLGGFALAPGGVAARGLQAALQTGGTGALYGAADARGGLTERGVGAGTGALFALGTAGLFGGAGKMFAPKVDDAAARLVRDGVPLTPGQLRGGAAMRNEDKLMSKPFIGDRIAEARRAGLEGFNRAAVNRTLAPLNETLPDWMPVGREAVEFAQQRVGDAYGAVVPKIVATPDPQFQTGLAGIRAKATTLPTAQQKQLKAVLAAIEGKPLAGQAAKDAESELGRIGREYATSSVAGERELGRLVREAQDELRDLFGRSAGPNVADELSRANAAYAGLLRTENAASRLGAHGGTFTPAQYAAAVKATTTKKRFAAGTAKDSQFADDAVKVLPAKVPDSGTAGRQNMNLLGLAEGAVLRALLGPQYAPAKLAARSAAAVKDGPVKLLLRALGHQPPTATAALSNRAKETTTATRP